MKRNSEANEGTAEDTLNTRHSPGSPGSTGDSVNETEPVRGVGGENSHGIKRATRF